MGRRSGHRKKLQNNIQIARSSLQQNNNQYRRPIGFGVSGFSDSYHQSYQVFSSSTSTTSNESQIATQEEVESESYSDSDQSDEPSCSLSNI